ncbi:hypothetical protein NKY39_15955 [Sinorhizobium meliloti]|uniref:hypothetical protein n=1 Tax=Rhizobium meliloti TaxID=382 RepID=UPI003D652450
MNPQTNQAWRPDVVLDQDRLNITNRSRTSRLAWRGQFSPEFIEYLLSEVCGNIDSVYDPFCGSGTVLFEGARRGIAAYGAEVNPAAWHMAKLAGFGSLPPEEKHHVLTELTNLTGRYSGTDSLYDINGLSVDALMGGSRLTGFAKLAVAASILVGMGNASVLTAAALAKGSFAVLSVLKEVEETRTPAIAYLGDARLSPLPTESIGAVITSPPYINVFNYHQNYRFAAELLGWKPLEAARSEIGANRKFRQNRFMTVVQYCLDIQRSIFETTRLLKRGGRFIIILGRTSNVLGTPFLNGSIISDILLRDGNLEISHRAERVFKNRFGEAIYEDIIVAEKVALNPINHLDARAAGRDALAAGLAFVPPKNRHLLVEAIERFEEIAPSAMLELATPATFK